VVGYSDREPSKKDMDRMRVLLRETLDAGAIGLSTGLIYPPGIYAGTEELIELARYGGDISRQFIYTSHMRNEADRLLEAIEEAVGIGAGAGVAVHISHIKTAGKENWHMVDGAIALMEGARANGIKVTCDRYPYTAGSTDLDSVLPAWVFEGGPEDEMKRLADPEVRERIKAELQADDGYWEGVVISSVPSESGKRFEGKSIREIALLTGMECRDAFLNVLSTEGIRVGGIFFGMSDENLWKFLSLPYSMVASDSSARSFDGPTAKGKPHPRGFGTFPRFLNNHPGGLGEAIHKSTVLPAETFGLRGRGAVRAGFKADLVVFDAQRLADRATYNEPFRRPEGIFHVIINGTPALLDGEPTDMRPGRVLRGRA
jgi:N-acyl-D-amino-acid deacylase